MQHCQRDQTTQDPLALTCAEDAPGSYPKSSFTLDTTRKTQARKTKETSRRTEETELEEMGLTWDEAQKIAKEIGLVKWRGLVAALCPTGGYKPK